MTPSPLGASVCKRRLATPGALLVAAALLGQACTSPESAPTEVAGKTSVPAVVAKEGVSIATRDEKSALDIVRFAIASSGGETWRRPKTLQLSGRAVMTYGGLESERDVLHPYKMWRVFPSESAAAHTANGKVRFDAFVDSDEAREDARFLQIAFDGKGSHRFYAPEAERYQEIAGWSNSFGFGILRFADGEDFELTKMASDQVEGNRCWFIKVKDPSGQETMFGIDQEGGEVRLVGFPTPAGYHHRIYSEFAQVEGVSFRQPQRVRIYFDGAKWNDIHWQEFAVNEPIADEIFTNFD